MEGHPQRRRGLAGWARLVLAGIAAGVRALQGELLQLRALALTTITGSGKLAASRRISRKIS